MAAWDATEDPVEATPKEARPRREPNYRDPQDPIHAVRRMWNEICILLSPEQERQRRYP